jgi:carlactone synthase/all-trans-10'-apo-beta-carotenal 13,14-cleaving dioxygenase
VTEQPLEVTGTLPPWLSGQLLVNGGGDYSASKHMFDGYAFISKLRVEGGQAWGSQRYVDTRAYRAYKATGEALPGVLFCKCTRCSAVGSLLLCWHMLV